MPSYFNGPCQCTPLLNFHSLIFSLMPLQLAAFYYATPLSLREYHFLCPFDLHTLFLEHNQGVKKGWVYSLPRMITAEKRTGNRITSLFTGLFMLCLKTVTQIPIRSRGLEGMMRVRSSNKVHTQKNGQHRTIIQRRLVIMDAMLQHDNLITAICATLRT